ncbi:MAG: hypothetical protein WD824_03825 [Cyclobacteriaceae bacterium]
MRNKIFSIIILGMIIVACEEETKVEDPIYEFAAFKGTSAINLNEAVNSVKPYPLVIELKAFKPYPQDIDVSLEITGSNAEENVDFTVTPSSAVKIRAGKLVSDTIFIETIDNAAGSTQERSFDIRIKSISNDDINIGLGLAEPRNAVITVNILDDECSETIAIFNSNALVNTLDWGGGDVIKPATGVVTGNTVKVTGDLIDYGAFSNASVTITLTPESDGATKGEATFGEQETGADSDGYEYKFIQTGEGAYDVCSGAINVEYDIYYMDGGWVYWYSVANIYSIP